jgi:hypothetical protein
MKNIILYGTTHAKWLIPELKKLDKENQYILLETFSSLKSLVELFRADTVFFIYAPLSKRQKTLLKILIFFRKKIVIDWIGTDVLNVLKENKKQTNIFTQCSNLCEINWIKDELEIANISAKVGPYITRLYHNLEVIDIRKENKDEFIIMSYSGEGREKFYGIDKLLNLAIKFPHLKFKIVGTRGNCYNNIPSNMEFLGWIPSTKEILSESSLFIRIPEHDGLSLSVLEALYYEKQVVFSFPFPYTYHITNDGDLENIVDSVYNKWKNQESIFNINGKEYVVNQYFNKQEKFLKNLQNILISD